MNAGAQTADCWGCEVLATRIIAVSTSSEVRCMTYRRRNENFTPSVLEMILNRAGGSLEQCAPLSANTAVTIHAWLGNGRHRMLSLRILQELRNSHARGSGSTGRSEGPRPGTMFSSPQENANRCALTCRRGHNADFWVTEPSRAPKGPLWPSIPRFLLKSASDLPWR